MLPSLLLPLLVAGCFTLRPELPVVRVAGEETRMATLLRAARAGGQARQALRAVGKLHLDSPRGSGSVREVIVIQRPDRLRFESLNLLGHTQALLVSDGERFAFYDGKTLSGGAVSSKVLRDLVGLDFDPAEAIEVLLAAPPIEPGPPTGVLGQGSDRIAELSSQRVRFDATGELRGFDALGPDGSSRWSVEYDEWEEVGRGRYPFALRLSFPETETRARLDVREAELNPELDASLFFVPTGAGE